jgi:hypothetical protein
LTAFKTLTVRPVVGSVTGPDPYSGLVVKVSKNSQLPQLQEIVSATFASTALAKTP